MANLPQSGVELVAAGSSAFFGSMRDAARALDTFSDRTDRSAKRVNAFSEIVIGGFRSAGDAIFGFGRDALRSMGSFISGSIDIAGDFEQTMSILAETSDATADQVALVSQKAKALGADLTLPATSAVDAGEAMLELSKAGFSVQQSMDAAKGTLQLAAAAQIEEAKAAEITSNAINAFGLEASDAVFVSDLLAASASASSIEISDTALSFKMASAIFANFQGPIVGSKEAMTDLTTAIGILGNAGIKGSSAGTYLSQALQQLTGPSDKAKDLMKDLAARIGVTGDIAFDSAGNMRSFQEIIGLTAQATAGMTDEQRSFYLTTIYGSDGMKALLPLMAAGAEGWDKMAAAVTRQGAAADLAAAQTEGYKGAVGGLKSQLETIQLTIGQAVIPVITDLLRNHINPAVAGFGALADKILTAASPFTALAGEINKAIPGFAAFVQVLKTGEASAAGWARITNMFASLFGPAIGGVFLSVTQNVVSFGSSVKDTFSTLQPVFSTFNLLLRDGEVSAAGWARMGNILQRVFGADLGSILQRSISLVGDIVREFQTAENISILFKRISDDLGLWANDIIPIVQDSLSRMRDAFLGWVSDSLPDWKEALSLYAVVGAEWVKDAIPDLLDNLVDMREQLFSWVSDSLPGWLTEVGRFAEPAAEWILDAVPPLLDNVGTFIKRVTDQTLTYLPEWGATLVEFGVKAVTWITDALPSLTDNLGKFANEMANWVVDSLPRWGAQLAEFGGKAVGWVLDALPGLGTNLGSMTGKILGWVVETAIDVVPKLADLGLKFVTWVATDVLPELPGALLNIATGIYNFIAELLAEVSPKIMEVSAKFTDWVQEDVLPRLPGVLDDIKTGITTWIRDTTIWVGTELTAIGKGLVDGIKKGIQDNWNSFKNWVLGLLEGLKDAILEFFNMGSPSRVMAVEVGEPIVLGMLEGMQGAFPELMNYVTTMTDEIRRQFEDTADAITDTIISIQRSTAGGYRTQAANMAKLADFSDTSDLERDIKETEERRYDIFLKLQEEIARGNDANQTTIEQYKEQIALLEERKTALTQTAKDQEFVSGELENRLNTAFKEAQNQFTDPRDVMRYYDLLSEQAFEFADLQQQYYDAVAKSDTERMVRLSDQMLLIDRAQALEREAFTTEANKENELLELQQQIEGLKEHATIIGDATEGILTFFETLAEMMNYALGDIPGFAKGGFAQGGKMITVGERGRELFIPQTDGWIIPNGLTDGLLSAFSGRTSPSASAQQIMTSSTNNYTYGGPTYNLGVTTNQSPAVVQQSFATMWALA